MNWTEIEAKWHLNEIVTVKGFRKAADAGILDGRGRAIGATVTIWPAHSGYPDYQMQPNRYEVRVQATRDCVKFGALAPRSTVDGLEAAQALGEKKLAASIARSRKTHGK